MPASADVLVAGTGITGLAAAIELQRAGLSAVAVDAGRVGFGATSRSMGLVSGVPKENERYLLDLIAASGADCDLQQGALLLAPTARNFKDLEASLPSRLERYGLEDRMLPASEIAAEVGEKAASKFVGALLMPGAQHLHPGKLVVALAAYAQRLGVQVCENVSVDRSVSGFDKVVFATGGYTDGLPPDLMRRTLPVPSIAAASEPLDDAQPGELLPGGKLVVVNRFRGYNWRLSPDGRRVLIAGPVATTPRSASNNLARLRRDLARWLPSLDQVQFSHCWTGYAGATRDRGVHIGRDGYCWYVLGSSGLANSAVAGRDAARCILADEAPEHRTFAAWPLRKSERGWWATIRGSAKLLDLLRRSRPR